MYGSRHQYICWYRSPPDYRWPEGPITDVWRGKRSRSETDLGQASWRKTHWIQRKWRLFAEGELSYIDVDVKNIDGTVWYHRHPITLYRLFKYNDNIILSIYLLQLPMGMNTGRIGNMIFQLQRLTVTYSVCSCYCNWQEFQNNIIYNPTLRSRIVLVEPEAPWTHPVTMTAIVPGLNGQVLMKIICFRRALASRACVSNFSPGCQSTGKYRF